MCRGRQLHRVSVALGMISCLTVRPEQLAGGLAGSGVAAPRAVNLLIVFGIQSSGGANVPQGDTHRPLDERRCNDACPNFLTCERQLNGGLL